jgi:uncharacterized protein (TIGR00255 family)
MVRKRFRRGRVDVSLAIQRPTAGQMLVNADAARSFLEMARQLGRELKLADNLDLAAILALPGIVVERDQSAELPEAEEMLSRLVAVSVDAALDGAVGMRRQEGEALQSDIAGRVATMREGLVRIRELEPTAVQEYRLRMSERLALLLPPAGVDDQRLAEEVAVMAERSDISEELARLESHLGQMEELMRDGGEAGKRMDFLLQEIQREVNTVLSKTASLQIKREGMALKAEIEKVREQAQNVE